MPSISLSIRPRRVLVGLIILVLGLVVVGVAANLVLQARPSSGTAALTRPFLLDEEDTIPTYVSSALLGVCALLLVLGGLSLRRRRGPHWVRWLLLATVFAYLSLEEIVQTHERWDVLLRAALDDPTLARAWVVVALVLVGLTAAIWLPVLLGQRGRQRVLWVLAGVLYLGGALAVELLSMPYEPPENARLGYVLLVALEEGMEMLGISVFLYALLAGDAGAENLHLSLGRAPDDADHERDSTST